MRKIDKYATEMIPIRLIISITVIAAISLMICFGYMHLKVVLAENQMENECEALESELLSLLASGVSRDVNENDVGSGTMRIHSFNLPDNLVFLGIGVDPDINNDGNYETGLTEDGTVIFYKIDGGSKKVLWLDESFRFREGIYDGDKWITNDNQGYILIDSGKYVLTFELVEKFHEKYILIQANDGIEL